MVAWIDLNVVVFEDVTNSRVFTAPTSRSSELNGFSDSELEELLAQATR